MTTTDVTIRDQAAETGKLLYTAAAHLESVGLHQGGAIDRAQRAAGMPERSCRVCAMGALSLMADGKAAMGAASSEEVFAALRAVRDYLGVALPAYNDAYGRTAAQVAEVMRRTADRLCNRRLRTAA